MGKILLCTTVVVEIDKLDWAHTTIFWILMFVSIDLCCSKLCLEELFPPAVGSSYYRDLQPIKALRLSNCLALKDRSIAPSPKLRGSGRMLRARAREEYDGNCLSSSH